MLPFLLAIGTLLLAPTAAADAPAPAAPVVDDARARFNQAKADYKAGNFEAALQGFESAYAQRPLPAILYNIAQCHMNIGNYERAAFFYDAFLHEGPAEPLATEVREQRAAAEQKHVEQRAHEAARLDQERLVEARRLEEERAARVQETRILEAQRAAAERAEVERLDAEERSQALSVWSVVAGASIATVLAAGAVTAIVVALLPPPVVAPSGSLGAIDRRGEAP